MDTIIYLLAGFGIGYFFYRLTIWPFSSKLSTLALNDKRHAEFEAALGKVLGMLV